MSAYVYKLWTYQIKRIIGFFGSLTLPCILYYNDFIFFFTKLSASKWYECSVRCVTAYIPFGLSFIPQGSFVLTEHKALKS